MEKWQNNEANELFRLGSARGRKHIRLNRGEIRTSYPTYARSAGIKVLLRRYLLVFPHTANRLRRLQY
jgi:hypothetical protein